MKKFFKNLSIVLDLLSKISKEDAIQMLKDNNYRQSKVIEMQAQELQRLKGRITNYRNQFANDEDVRTQFVNEFPANFPMSKY